MAHKRALLSSKGISAFGLGGYPDSDEVELIPTVAGQRRTFTILLGSTITGFPLAAFASGLKATYAEYLVGMLEYSPATPPGSRMRVSSKHSGNATETLRKQLMEPWFAGTHSSIFRLNPQDPSVERSGVFLKLLESRHSPSSRRLFSHIEIRASTSHRF